MQTVATCIFLSSSLAQQAITSRGEAMDKAMIFLRCWQTENTFLMLTLWPLWVMDLLTLVPLYLIRCDKHCASTSDLRP